MLTICRRRRIRSQNRRGATAVEFAIVAPVFFLVIFALFEFAWTNVMRHTADNAAYEAARLAMVPGATAAEAVNRANGILRIVGTRGATVTVDPPVLNDSTEAVTVTINVPLNQNAIVTPRFTGSTVLQSSTTLRTERVEK